MNAYLFIAGLTQSQIRPTHLGNTQTADRLQVWDSCTSVIVCGENPAAAQKEFEAWPRGSPDAEHPVQVEIKRLVAAQFLEKLLTESGRETLDWLQIAQRVESTLQSAEGDDFEQGYWADANQLVRPEKLSPDVESLQRDLPEETRTGLNWSVDKQFFFIVSVLSPPALPAGPDYEKESGRADPDYARDENSNETQSTELDPVVAALPKLRDKEVAALVQARNSIVAAWLWRRFATDTQFAANDIDIEPWCGVMAIEANRAIPDEGR